PQAYAGAILPDGRRSPLPVATMADPVPDPGPETVHDHQPLVKPDQQVQSSPLERTIRRQDRTIAWRQLPWLQLAAWGVGYGFLGLALICLGAAWWAWPLVGLSSLLWVWQPRLLRSQPLIAVVTVILSTGLSWLGLGLGLLLWAIGAVGLRLTGYPWERAIELGGWLGGTGCLTVATIPLLLSRQPSLGGAIASKTWLFSAIKITWPPSALTGLSGYGP
ncbi:hypothetical protein C7293_30470, partial [filamentous cyanobacterium CCT1]